MQLKIDLSNRAEVAAALPLLQLVLGYPAQIKGATQGPVQIKDATQGPAIVSPLPPPVYTPGAPMPPASGVVLTEADALADLNGTPRPDNPSVPPVQPAPFNTPASMLLPDPAAVFGGQPAVVPAGAVPFAPPTAAPFSAGVAPSLNVPGGPLGGDQAAPTGAYPSAPPTAPAAVAPTAGAMAASPANGVDLDIHGLPWDERIHAGTKRKNADGSWTAKRGLNDPALLQRVQAELRARVAGQGPAATPAAAPVAPAPVAPPVAVVPPFVPPVAGFPPVQPAAPSAPAAPTTFEQFMTRVTPACMQGVMPLDAVQGACIAQGLPNVQALQQHPTFIPQTWAYLQAQFPALV